MHLIQCCLQVWVIAVEFYLLSRILIFTWVQRFKTQKDPLYHRNWLAAYILVGILLIIGLDFVS